MPTLHCNLCLLNAPASQPWRRADYGDALRLALRQRDGITTQEDERLLARLERLKARAKLEGPDIERTLLKLAKQPQERALWQRLWQRLLGYGVGLLEARR